MSRRKGPRGCSAPPSCSTPGKVCPSLAPNRSRGCPPSESRGPSGARRSSLRVSFIPRTASACPRDSPAHHVFSRHHRLLTLPDKAQQTNLASPALAAGHRFTTYAYQWIFVHVNRACQNYGRTIRVPVRFPPLLHVFIPLLSSSHAETRAPSCMPPLGLAGPAEARPHPPSCPNAVAPPPQVSIYEKLPALVRAKTELSNSLGRPPSHEEVAARMGKPVAEARRSRALLRRAAAPRDTQGKGAERSGDVKLRPARGAFPHRLRRLSSWSERSPRRSLSTSPCRRAPPPPRPAPGAALAPLASPPLPEPHGDGSDSALPPDATTDLPGLQERRAHGDPRGGARGAQRAEGGGGGRGD